MSSSLYNGQQISLESSILLFAAKLLLLNFLREKEKQVPLYMSILFRLSIKVLSALDFVCFKRLSSAGQSRTELLLFISRDMLLYKVVRESRLYSVASFGCCLVSLFNGLSQLEEK